MTKRTLQNVLGISLLAGALYTISHCKLPPDEIRQTRIKEKEEECYCINIDKRSLNPLVRHSFFLTYYLQQKKIVLEETLQENEYLSQKIGRLYPLPSYLKKEYRDGGESSGNADGKVDSIYSVYYNGTEKSIERGKNNAYNKEFIKADKKLKEIIEKIPKKNELSPSDLQPLSAIVR